MLEVNTSAPVCWRRVSVYMHTVLPFINLQEGEDDFWIFNKKKPNQFFSRITKTKGRYRVHGQFVHAIYGFEFLKV